MSKTTDREPDAENEEESGSESRIVPPSEIDIPEDANVVDLRDEPDWMRPPDGEGDKPVSQMDDDELEEFNEKLERMLEEIGAESES
jgi:hypothetical protein